MELAYNDNKKRNIVGYVLCLLGFFAGALTILLIVAANNFITYDNPAIIVLFGVFLILVVFAISMGIVSFGFFIASLSILGSCVKDTTPKRRTVNIVLIVINSIFILLFTTCYILLIIASVMANNG